MPTPFHEAESIIRDLDIQTCHICSKAAFCLPGMAVRQRNLQDSHIHPR